MSEARFRFYAELNDFLPAENRMKEFVRHFAVSRSVKGLIESFGVPHTEIELPRRTESRSISLTWYVMGTS